MTDEPPPMDAESYIRANRARYTRDAIAARLIEAGHDPAAVETALERVLAVDAGASPAPKAGSRARLVAKLLVIAALFLGSIAIALGSAIALRGIDPISLGAANIVILVIALGLFRLIDRRLGGHLVEIDGALPLAERKASPSGLARKVADLLSFVVFMGYGGAVLLGLTGAGITVQFVVVAPGALIGGDAGGLVSSVWLLLYSGAMLFGGRYSIRRLARAPSATGAGRAIFIALVIAVAIFAGLSGVCQVGYNVRL